jgi:hypothetical protein
MDQASLKRRLAACLMESFADGEHDPLRLANSAVRRMRQESGQKIRLWTEPPHFARVVLTIGTWAGRANRLGDDG